MDDMDDMDDMDMAPSAALCAMEGRQDTGLTQSCV